MSKQTISIGGATYDIFTRLSHDTVKDCCGDDAFTLPLGDKIRISDVLETCGGGASNTSVGLSRLGCNASFCGVVGSDQWGEKLKENLEQENVDTRCMTVVEDEVSSFSIILSDTDGERVILYDPGTNDHLHDATFDREAVANQDWVYFNHIQESSCVIEDDIIAILAQDESPNLTWNPGGCQIDVGIDAPNNRKLLEHTTMLQLNKSEALGFTKQETIEQAMKTLIDLGVTNVCITDGNNGTTACDGVKVYHCPVREDVKVLDTTGAGDAFGTAVTWALLSGLRLPEALKAGSINAASVVGAYGAQAGLLTHIEIESQLQTTTLDVSEQLL